MDGRQALSPGTILKLSTKTGYTLYTIKREAGRGATCIVYDASYTDNIGNFKLVRIKECYPHALRISRSDDNKLIAAARDEQAFQAAKDRLLQAYRKNHDLFSVGKLTNAVANTSDIYQENGTVYIVSVYMNGKTFADFQGESLHDCILLLISAAKALRHIHEAGYLYLDLKPDNILTLEGSLDLVQLFDFDSTVSMAELSDAIESHNPAQICTSYTRGYASLEQQTGKLRQLGRHSDLYSLGAVLFYALWHRTPSAFDCEPSCEYDWAHMTYAGKDYRDALFPALTAFFRKTLASYYADRYQSAEEAIGQLEEILRLSDEKMPWIQSTHIPKNVVFYGRQSEIASLAELLESVKGGIAVLYGMGGIGKSSLARAYLAEHREDWDAILWLHDQGNLSDAIADDAQVRINTIRRMKEESAEEYLQRKLRSLSELAHEQRVLLVLDNFDSEHLNRTEPLRQVGWTILLISRSRMPEGMFPEMCLREMPDDDLAELFAHYSHCDLSDPVNFKCFRAIITAIKGHTLLTELIARQIAKSYLDLQRAEAMLAGIGLADLSTEQIDYIRDQKAYHGTLLKILDRLVEIDRFTQQDTVCLKLLSMIDMPGIDCSLFQRLAELESLDFINDLESAGWLHADLQKIYLHPMMQEYIRTWAWTEPMKAAADRMMRNLYELIRPAGIRHDGSKQFPTDYGSLYALLWIADQMIAHCGRTTEASQRLLYRLLMDAPVDQDAHILFRMLDLLKNPAYLDNDSILRLYECAAYMRARLYDYEGAIELLKQMKKVLRKHPSAYYLSAYHRAMAVILHNADEYGNLKKCLDHQGRAIAAAKLSSHPDAKKQLASCLLDKATTLLSADMGRAQARKLIMQAKPLIEDNAKPTDYERYQYACIAAMCCAMDGYSGTADALLRSADDIAFGAPDSDLSIAEHLLEQVAPIRIAMEEYEAAEHAILQAIALCDKHEEALRYRETRFDAYLFLGRVYAMDEEYIKAEQAFAEAEKHVEDSPYEHKLPLCPQDIREMAEREREGKNAIPQ